MRTLDYNYGTASGYVQPYPLLDNISLAYPVLVYTAPVGQDYHTALLNSLVSIVVNGVLTSITLPTTNGNYVYVTSPSIINVDNVMFNGFPVQLVPVETNTNYTVLGTLRLFNTYRFPFPQHGTNFTISLGTN